MSAYETFLVDFPSRCNELWKKFNSSAQDDDREVTLLLMTLSSGFAISYQRLNDSQNLSADRVNQNTVSEKIGTVLDLELSNLKDDFNELKLWKIGKQSLNGRKCISASDFEAPKMNSSELKVRDVFNVIASGIKRGNIFVLDGSSERQI